MMDRDENPDAPPTAEEIAAASALRDALADPSRVNPSADLLRSVALAHAPRVLSPQAHRAILERSIVRAEVRRADRSKRTRGALLRTGGGVVAIAAALALVVGLQRSSSAPQLARAPTVPSRSTGTLFHEPFARVGGESARIDRIASAYASELRDDRFAAWGVR